MTSTDISPPPWADFISRLAGVIGELEPDEFLVLAAANNRFAQLSVQDFALRVESVGNQYLEPRFKLSAQDQDQLEELGFDPPTHTPEVDDDKYEGSPNFWIELPTETPAVSVATLMASTLVLVHHVESPSDLSYECSELLGGHIPQPALRLPRTDDRGRPNEAPTRGTLDRDGVQYAILPRSDWGDHPWLSRLEHASDFDGDGAYYLADLSEEQTRALEQIILQWSNEGRDWEDAPCAGWDDYSYFPARDKASSIAWYDPFLSRGCEWRALIPDGWMAPDH